MKLRNKKTGLKYTAYTPISFGICDGVQSFDSIKELCEKWEDYKPKEPLIKDEKIRNFVREWAEVNGFKVLKYLEGSRMCELSYRLKNDDGDVVMELLGSINGLENCKEYTIEELCGENEE